MLDPLQVGVDVDRQSNTVTLMDHQGREVAPPFTVANNLPGTQAFVQQVAQQVIDGNFDGIRVAAEATGWYWFLFFQTLSQDPLLNQWPLELYPINPRLTAKFRETYVDLDKTDLTDSFVVADRLRMGRDLPQPFCPDDTYLPLRFLTRYRYHVVHNITREKACFLALLYLKASEYSHKDKRRRPFSNLFGATSRAVIQEFASIEEIAAIPFDELVEFIDHKGKRRFPDPTDNARRLQRVARESYPLPEALQRPIHQILHLSLQQISFLERQEKRLSAAISERVAEIPHTLETIPGIGPVFSAGIIAEIGDLARFDYEEAKVAHFAGFKWRRTQSGDFQADETRLTRRGNRFLRYYFCEAANRVRLCDPEYATFYDRKYREVRKHQHKRALVLTARKLVRLVVALLSTNQPYQPRRRSRH
jgi:hypothetical protein